MCLWDSPGEPSFSTYLHQIAFLTSPRSSDHICLYGERDGRDVWCISPEVSAARALSIVTLLRVMALFEGSAMYAQIDAFVLTPYTELSEAANTVMTFYATSLASAVGPSYQPPSLVFLAQRWFDGSS